MSFDLAPPCSEDAEILFHFCECDHLGGKGNDNLNIGDLGSEKDHRNLFEPLIS